MGPIWKVCFVLFSWEKVYVQSSVIFTLVNGDVVYCDELHIQIMHVLAEAAALATDSKP